MLGDSFTWGWGVEKNETFSDIIEKDFYAQGDKIDVINAGFLSYSPLLEYLYLKNKGLEYKPDIVILNFDMSDVQDDYNYEKQAVFNSIGELLAVPSSLSGKKQISFQLKTPNFIYNLLKRIFVKVPNKQQINSPLLYDIRYSRYSTTLNNQFQNIEHWNRSLNYITLINDLCLKNNITFILVTYPYGHQVNTEEWKEGRCLFGFGSDIIYGDTPENLLKSYSEENNINFIETFEKFRESNQSPLFFQYDGHFTRNGHKLIAEILLDSISEKIAKEE